MFIRSSRKTSPHPSFPNLGGLVHNYLLSRVHISMFPKLPTWVRSARAHGECSQKTHEHLEHLTHVFRFLFCHPSFSFRAAAFTMSHWAAQRFEMDQKLTFLSLFSSSFPTLFFSLLFHEVGHARRGVLPFHPQWFLKFSW